jgi:hypothetical protein
MSDDGRLRDRSGPTADRVRAVVFAGLPTLLACSGPPTSTDATIDESSDSTESSESSDTEGAQLRPNWYEDVAPIIHANCMGCHADGGVGPFALDGYPSAAAWSSQIAASVGVRSMPPWGAHDTPECQPAHGWVGDLRLSEAEISTLVEWDSIGAPEGDPDDAAPLPSPTGVGLEDPDGIFPMPSPLVVGGTQEIYACISIDPGFDQDVWITGAELLVDNEAILHHAIMMIDPTGASAELADANGTYPCELLHEQVRWFGSYFPGAGPTLMPTDVGAPFPAGGRMVLSMHYHPTGMGADVDQSALALRWTTDPPAYDAVITAIGNAATAAQGLHFGPGDPGGVPTFLIPAGATEHTETMSAVFPDGLPDSRLFMLTPHMHSLGTDFKVTVERDQQRSCLIQNPGWDRDWQLVYTVDEQQGSAPTVREGDRIELRCTYDNSLGNPALVELLAELGLDQPIDAVLGDSGVNEMCMLIYGVALPHGLLEG